MKVESGKLSLVRKDSEYKAAYGFVKGELPTLQSRIDILHAKERQHFNNLKFEKRQRSYLLGRLSARAALGEQLSEAELKSLYISFGVFKFPVIKDLTGPTLQLSISHCEGIGLALAFPEEHPLAIDIEKINPAKIEAMLTMIHDQELNLLAPFDLSKTEQCTLLWTIKEGLSKIIRTGLSMDLKLIELLRIEFKEGFYESHFTKFGQFKVRSYIGKEFAVSLALPKFTEIDMIEFGKELEKMI